METSLTLKARTPSTEGIEVEVPTNELNGEDYSEARWFINSTSINAYSSLASTFDVDCTYHPNNVPTNLYIKSLKQFLHSNEFSELCCEFYILRCTTTKRGSDKLIEKFAHIAKNSFNSYLNTHSKKMKQDIPLYCMMQDIFKKLVHDNNNIAFITTVLLNPILELILLRNSTSADIQSSLIKDFIQELKNKHDFTNNKNSCADFSKALQEQVKISKKIQYMKTRSNELMLSFSTFATPTLVITILSSILFMKFFGYEVPFYMYFLFTLSLALHRKFSPTEKLRKVVKMPDEISSEISTRYDELTSLIIIDDLEKKAISNPFKSLISFLQNKILLPNINLRVFEKNNNKFEYPTANITNLTNQFPKQNSLLSDAAAISLKGKNKSLQTKPKISEKPISLVKQPEVITPNNSIIISKHSITSNCPSTDIHHNDLKKVIGRHGNQYHIYWDDTALSNDRLPIITRIKGIFDKAEEVRGSTNSSGINKLQGAICKSGLVFTHEVKLVGTASRVYGSIYLTEIGFVVVFYYFDNSGRETNH
ncbi:MAG: hypothetical protein ACK5Z5_08280 [Neisseriaceae bacterium]